MRVTDVLFRKNYYRLIKRMWKKQSKLIIAPLEVPSELKVMGVNIYDALDVAKDCENKTFKDVELVSTATSANVTKYYLFDDKVQVSDDENHVLVLTKTLSYNGLPPVLTSLIGRVSLPNQDQLVRNSILQAVVRDGYQHEMPKIELTEPRTYFPRTYGIPYERKAANLMQKLACLCEMASGRYPETLYRSRNIDAFSELDIDREGKPITFQMTADIALTSKFPLQPIANPEEVDDTKNVELPSIYPIKPTLDLWQMEEKPSKFGNIDFSDANPLSDYHLHTLHFVQKSSEIWEPVQKISRAIALCFTFAAEEARRIYGSDIKILPKPVTVQLVYSDVQVMGFMVYQLNTLEMSDHIGIKNQVWIEDAKNMYGEVTEIDGITEYNSRFFPKMLAFYMNGLKDVTS